MSEHAKPQKCEKCSYVMRSLVDALSHPPEVCAEWQRHDELLRLRAEHTECLSTISDLREQMRAWSLALQSVTAGGSEFVDDPARCVAFVRDVRDSNFRTIKRLHRRAQAAESEVLSLRKQLEARPAVNTWASNERKGEAVERDDNAGAIEDAETKRIDQLTERLEK